MVAPCCGVLRSRFTPQLRHGSDFYRRKPLRRVRGGVTERHQLVHGHQNLHVTLMRNKWYPCLNKYLCRLNFAFPKQQQPAQAAHRSQRQRGRFWNRSA